MYSSDVLLSIITQQEELSSSVEKQKERDINKVIENIKDYDEADRSINMGFQSAGTICTIFLIVFFCYSVYSIGWDNADNFRRAGWIIVALVLGATMCFIPHLFLQTKKTSILPYLKDLFINVCSKPYEFRIEFVKNEKGVIDRSKAKVVIEKNVLVDGSHVIKEKSEHISAYLDLTQSKDSLIYMIHTLAKKAEEKF